MDTAKISRTFTTAAGEFASNGSPLPHFQHTPLSDPNRIRLLKIAPLTSDEIVVFLEEVDLDASILYECLSYTWNDPKFRSGLCDVREYWTTSHKRIVCNNAVTYIRQNLHDALVRLRDSGHLGPIWIDALSINQDDVSERNSQVGRMGCIYEGASRVIVWLGEEDEHTQPALELIKRFTLTLEEFFKSRDPNRYDYLLRNYNYEEILTIHYFLLLRSWFSRLWIIQETIHASELQFICGSHILSLETIWRGLMIVCLNPKSPKGIHSKRFLEIEHFYSIVMIRHKWLQTQRTDHLGYNLHAYRSSQSSDPRDKVFGLLGISNTSDTRISTNLIADYDMTPQKVYTKAALFTLYDRQNLSALATVGDQSLNRILDLPSWVPDLSVDEMPASFERANIRFSAATREPCSFDFNEDTLILQGYLWDQISFSSESISEIENGKGVSNLVQVFTAPSSPYTYSGEPLEKAIERLFIADKLRANSHALIARMNNKYDTEAAFKMLFSRIMYFGLHKAGEIETLKTFLNSPKAFLQMFTKHPGTWATLDALASIFNILGQSFLEIDSVLGSDTGSRSESSSLYHWLNCGTDPFAKSWYSRFLFRRYFRTSRGYLGLGIRNTRPGDSIYLIKGASVPYIFRPVSENPADGLKLVGEAYVHGIMYGEALSGEPVAFESIEIH